MPARRRKKAGRRRKSQVAPYVVTYPDPPQSVFDLARDSMSNCEVVVANSLGVVMAKDHKYAIQQFLIDGKVLSIITER